MYRPRGEGSLALAPDMRADLCSIPVSSLQNPLSNEKTDLIPVQALRLPETRAYPVLRFGIIRGSDSGGLEINLFRLLPP